MCSNQASDTFAACCVFSTSSRRAVSYTVSAFFTTGCRRKASYSAIASSMASLVPEPGELVRAQIDARLEVLLVALADPRVAAVGDHDEIGVGKLLEALDLALEAHLHAELAPAVLQDVEQRDARAAAEAVAARAQR